MDLFVIDFAVKLGFEVLKKKIGGWVGSLLFSGPLGFIASQILVKVLNFWVREGIIVVDVQINRLKEHLSLKEYTEFTKKAYKNASKKVYSDEEKQRIREAYLDALAKFGAFNFVPDDSRSERKNNS